MYEALCVVGRPFNFFISNYSYIKNLAIKISELKYNVMTKNHWSSLIQDICTTLIQWLKTKLNDTKFLKYDYVTEIHQT